jgi:hypothetical protein
MRLIGIVIPGMRQGFQVVDDVIWEGTFGGRFADRAHALSVFADHNREVQAAVQADRLLVFDVKQGWEPLCAFLGVPVPEGEPFPHVNDSADFARRQGAQYVRLGRALLPAVGFAMAGAVLGLVFGLNRRRANRSMHD